MIEFVLAFLLGLLMLLAGVYALWHPAPEDGLFTVEAVRHFIRVMVLGKEGAATTTYFDGAEKEERGGGGGGGGVLKQRQILQQGMGKEEAAVEAQSRWREKHPKLLKRLQGRCGNKKCPLRGEGRKLAACLQCKVVAYCGKECQKEDWQSHKVRCKVIHKMRTEGKFPIVGVSLKWLLSDTITEKMLEVKITEDAIHHVFIKMTEQDKCSVADYLTKASPHLVKPVADTFITHVWSYDVEDFLQALFNELQEWCEDGDVENKEEDVFIWADFLCLNQHEPIVKDDEFWSSYLPECLQAINHSTVIASKWQNPQFLNRSWCLWEILHHQGEIRMGMNKTQRDMLFASLKRDPIDAACKTIIERFNFAAAEASEPKVKERILECIMNWKDGGPKQVEAIIMKALRGWLLQEIEQVIGQMEVELEVKNRTQSTGIADMLARQDEQSAIAGMYEKMHWLAQNQQLPLESELGARKALEIYLEVFGNDHVKTACAREKIAVSISHQRKLDEALIELYESMRVYRMRNEKTLMISCLNNIGYILQGKNMFVQALEPFQEALGLLREFHGGRKHPEVAEALYQLANLDFKVGRISTARDEIEEAVKIVREVAPNYHKLKIYENALLEVEQRMQQIQPSAQPPARENQQKKKTPNAKENQQKKMTSNARKKT